MLNNKLPFECLTDQGWVFKIIAQLAYKNSLFIPLTISSKEISSIFMDKDGVTMTQFSITKTKFISYKYHINDLQKKLVCISSKDFLVCLKKIKKKYFLELNIGDKELDSLNIITKVDRDSIGSKSKLNFLDTNNIDEIKPKSYEDMEITVTIASNLWKMMIDYIKDYPIIKIRFQSNAIEINSYDSDKYLDNLGTKWKKMVK